MAALSSLIGKFAAMLDPDPANEGKLLQWIGEARTADLPHLHSFTRGLELDISAATAAVTLPHHNGRTEGVNNIKDQNDQTTDVRPRQLRAPSSPDPPRVRRRSVTPESATEPKERQSRYADSPPLGIDDRRLLASVAFSTASPRDHPHFDSMLLSPADSNEDGFTSAGSRCRAFAPVAPVVGQPSGVCGRCALAGPVARRGMQFQDWVETVCGQMLA